MLNMVISLTLSTLSAALVMKFVTDSLPIVMAVSIVSFFLPFILIVRVVMKKVEALMMSAQHDVQANRAEKAIASLKQGLKYGQWQFYVKQQIFSQIGSILYMKRDFNEAVPYLEKGFVRNWVSMAMLGIAYMKKNKTKKMIETFDQAVSSSRKEPMVYALYAFCLDKVGERQKAISILQKGLKKTANDERLQENIELLQAGKKMKMKGFGDMWYQFHLEKQGALIKKQTKMMTGRRKQVVR
ncbi:MAG: hypothetical protein GXP51_02705 [Deltaproteobacteria bacterium]|nr:hypothetical protein [Deltaproteobacteria bacterium]